MNKIVFFVRSWKSSKLAGIITYRKSSNRKGLETLHGDIEDKCCVNERADSKWTPETKKSEEQEEKADSVLGAHVPLLTQRCGIFDLRATPTLHHKDFGVDVLQFHPMVQREWAVGPHPIHYTAHFV